MAVNDKARTTFIAATTIPTSQCSQNLIEDDIATRELLQRQAIVLDKRLTNVYNSLNLDNDPTLQSGPTLKGPGKSG